MRKLNNKQKKILDNMSSILNIKSVDELPTHTKDTIEKLGMYENLDSDIDRYLSDAYFARVNKR